ncbi:Beta-barrel assembly-enhancing protease [Meiothermus luteus]|jgi:Flp pilus assembly protein TadD|uniref:Beta-barrel assembly-enhancing protease n=1 Tax=Meiothermus luteus TaxID=2026184 RepID=A0A399ELB9_9DEIN|nr:tetratricopeptide repeat protein [Meiothermus luteus]RIH82961.1 Beta-barrel assembly-enhancing protease [Meiothermus luteus]RMH58643.1 MAG: tetratricopeptide repeat protein [Deinococcota bacterium]
MKHLLCAALVVLSLASAQQNQAAAQQTLQQAQAALEAGRLNEAVQGFEAVIARDFTNYSAHFGLGLALYRLGDLRGAAFEFTQLTVLDPNRFEGWFNLGVVRDRQGQAAEAAEAFAKAVEVGEKANLGPADLKPAYVGQVKALRSQGQHEAAANAARRGLEKLPGDPELTSLLADSLVRAGKPLEALPVLYQIISREPGNTQAISQIADIYVAQGLPQRALREIDRGLEAAQDNSARAQLLLKKSTLQQDREQTASLQEAVRLDPKLWAAHYNLGVARLREGNARGALESFQNAYAQNPEEPRVLLGLATAYDRLGQAAEAGRFAAMAARLSQGNERLEALFLQGKSAYTLRRYSEAVELLSQLTQQKPDNAEAWFLLGVSQFNLKDYAAAAASLERAQSLAPSAATAANLGAALYSAGRYSDAERVLSQAVALDNRNPVAWYNLGLALRSLGRNAEARRAWQRSAELGYAPARELLR